jgi:hypothetical protein
MSENIAKAWDKAKGEDDASYAEASADLKGKLADLAAGVERAKGTTLELGGGDREKSSFDKFEDEYKKLITPKSKKSA